MQGRARASPPRPLLSLFYQASPLRLEFYQALPLRPSYGPCLRDDTYFMFSSSYRRFTRPCPPPPPSIHRMELGCVLTRPKARPRDPKTNGGRVEFTHRVTRVPFLFRGILLRPQESRSDGVCATNLAIQGPSPPWNSNLGYQTH